VRVPRRGTGAEQPVVARKSRNGDGAKGLYRSALLGGQPAMGGAYLQCFQSDAAKAFVVDELETLYGELEKPGERCSGHEIY
jgi:hypothetical protein